MSDISRLGDYLHQMAEAARDAQNFTEGMDYDTFLVDLSALQITKDHRIDLAASMSPKARKRRCL